jgi:hypothetical protein
VEREADHNYRAGFPRVYNKIGNKEFEALQFPRPRQQMTAVVELEMVTASASLMKPRQAPLTPVPASNDNILPEVCGRDPRMLPTMDLVGSLYLAPDKQGG